MSVLAIIWWWYGTMVGRGRQRSLSLFALFSHHHWASPLTPWASPLTSAHTMGQPAHIRSHHGPSPLTPWQPAHTHAHTLSLPRLKSKRDCCHVTASSKMSDSARSLNGPLSPKQRGSPAPWVSETGCCPNNCLSD